MLEIASGTLPELIISVVSVGGSLSRAAMHAFVKTATQIANEGIFDGFDGLTSNAELNKFFSADRKSLS